MHAARPVAMALHSLAPWWKRWVAWRRASAWATPPAAASSPPFSPSEDMTDRSGHWKANAVSSPSPRPIRARTTSWRASATRGRRWRSKALADRGLTERVRVNVVCPGHIATDRLSSRIRTLAAERGLDDAAATEALRASYGIARFGHAEEIARVVRFISSPEADSIRGATIDVDGGARPGIWHRDAALSPVGDAPGSHRCACDDACVVFAGRSCASPAQLVSTLARQSPDAQAA